MKQFKYATAVPLIGGNSIGNSLALNGQKPEFFISYTPFEQNDSNIRAYFPDVPYYQLDDPNHTFNPSLAQDLDFISAVCPCAGLSSFSSGSQEIRDSRNEWMYKTADYVLGQLKPKVFWGENAPGLFTSSGKRVQEKLFGYAQQYGYSFSLYKTSTEHHGIPQRRERTFYFFWRDSLAPVLENFRKPKKGLLDYLSEVKVGQNFHTEQDLIERKQKLHDNPYFGWLYHVHGDKYHEKMGEYLNKRDFNCTSLFSYSRNYDLYQSMLAYLEKNGHEKSAKRTKVLIEKIKTGNNYWDSSFTFYKPDGNFHALIARTLDAFHPSEDRLISTREAMHLMGLPHDFNLVTDQLNHICQNVPVCTAQDMTREVIAVLENKRTFSDATFLKQDNLSNTLEVVNRKNNILLNY